MHFTTRYDVLVRRLSTAATTGLDLSIRPDFAREILVVLAEHEAELHERINHCTKCTMGAGTPRGPELDKAVRQGHIKDAFVRALAEKDWSAA